MRKRLLTILLVYIPTGAVLLSILLVVLLKWVPVTYTPLMLRRSLQPAAAPVPLDRTLQSAPAPVPLDRTLQSVAAPVPLDRTLQSVAAPVPLDRPLQSAPAPMPLDRTLQSVAAPVKRSWTPIEDISDAMICAVIAAEDQRFFQHNGFDFQELGQMRQEHISDGSPIRGCSTISQQTAKNCFTWCTKTWLRKGIEAYFTVLIEKIWGKERILEVYLNVAEMGPGIYGVEAAADRFYHVHASDLTMADASSLACCLPNPLRRDPVWVNLHMPARRAQVAMDASKNVGLL